MILDRPLGPDLQFIIIYKPQLGEVKREAPAGSRRYKSIKVSQLAEKLTAKIERIAAWLRYSPRSPTGLTEIKFRIQTANDDDEAENETET